MDARLKFFFVVIFVVVILAGCSAKDEPTQPLSGRSVFASKEMYPADPSDLVAHPEGGQVRLTWEPPSVLPGYPIGYLVYRAAGSTRQFNNPTGRFAVEDESRIEEMGLQRISSDPLIDTMFLDPSPVPNDSVFYRVRLVEILPDKIIPKNHWSNESGAILQGYVPFLTLPTPSEGVVPVNTPTSLRVTIGIGPYDSLIESSVLLREVDASGNPVAVLGPMYDDGDLSHGDEIQGDGIFTATFVLNRPDPGQLHLMVEAQSLEEGAPVTSQSQLGLVEVVAPVPQEIADGAVATQEAGAQQYNVFAASYPPDQARSMTVQWLLSQPNVVSATVTASLDIFIHYSGGLTGAIVIDEPGVDGGGGVPAERGAGLQIPVSEQTVGILQPAGVASAVTNSGVVGSNRALVYAPNHEQFVSWGSAFEDDINSDLTGSQCPRYDVTYLLDAAADVDAFDHVADYGLVVIHTHGLVSDGEVMFMTGEEYSFLSGHLWDYLLGRLTTATRTGSDDTYWAILPGYISSRGGTCPSSVVYNGSCHSAENQTMATAFSGKGAACYFGFSETVGSGFDRDMALATLPSIIDGSMSTSQAFTPGQTDPDFVHAEFLMIPSTADVKVGSGLSNPDFEMGSLTGWTSQGDGRVITQLGFLLPTGGTYMSIVSTGLGYTTDSGRIEQQFCIPSSATTMELSWNFLSEEFMEWVGSPFQDYFTISLTDQSGGEHVVLSVWVDYLAANYTLIHVSPEISFDRGDVWMTGWQNLSYDCSGLAGQTVTLKMATGDVGDSIYDSAVLIDQVVIH